MKEPISIVSFAAISALGSTSEAIWKRYLNNEPSISVKKINGEETYIASLLKEDKAKIEALKQSDNKYKNLDETVLYAIYTARQAVQKANWNASDNFGINFGSSRGATNLFEKFHTEFLNNNVSSTLSSPTTTLGNISSWVAHDLQTKGPEVSHSITCSTALHSLLNGIAWLNSKMCSKFLVGGSEAPLTNFTIAQMKALKVYAQFNSENTNFPCRAFDMDKQKNTMVLGEGASTVCLEAGITKNAIAKITGIGYATEVLQHNTSVTANAECFQKSMKMALQNKDLNTVDVIVMHAPGTKRGDSSELNAIQKVFGKNLPFLTTNKWKLGHTFGASGLLSFELALLMLQHQTVIKVPFATTPQKNPSKINTVLINAVGFGGNAVSVLIEK